MSYILFINYIDLSKLLTIREEIDSQVTDVSAKQKSNAHGRVLRFYFCFKKFNRMNNTMFPLCKAPMIIHHKGARKSVTSQPIKQKNPRLKNVTEELKKRSNYKK